MTQVSVSIDDENLEWLQDEVRKGKFKSVSEGVRTAVKIQRLLGTEEE